MTRPYQPTPCVVCGGMLSVPASRAGVPGKWWAHVGHCLDRAIDEGLEQVFKASPRSAGLDRIIDIAPAQDLEP